MKRWMLAAAFLLTFVLAMEPALAARRVVVRRGVGRRTVVVVHRGWPLRRPLRDVVVRPARVAVRVAPVVFLAPVAFVATVARTAPSRDVLIWEDGETLDRQDDWTEFTLDCDTRGTKLWLEIPEGKLQLDWAEVVFENGDTRVVDFAEKAQGPGLYSLLDFRDGRKVDHVRMVARARTKEARVVLRMEK